MAGTRENLSGRGVFHDRPAFHDGDLRCEVEGEGEVVRDEDVGEAQPGLKVAEVLAEAGFSDAEIAGLRARKSIGGSGY